MRTDKTKLDRDVARRWKCSVRTARRWRLAGAPVHDDQAMRTWLVGQQTLPAGTRRLLDRTGSSGYHGTQRTPRPRPVPAGGSEGAEHALRRLEKAELSAFQKFEGAAAAGDAHTAKLARQSWLSIARELRGFDQTVGAERKVGDVVPREEAEKAIAATVWTLALHLRTSLLPVVYELRRAHNDGEAVNILNKVIATLVSLTVSVVHEGTYLPALRLSPWAAKAVSDGLENVYGDRTPEAIARYVRMIQQAGEALAQIEAERGLADANAERLRQKRLYCEAWRYSQSPPADVARVRSEIGWTP